MEVGFSPPPATSGTQCHLLTSTTSATCSATTNRTPPSPSSSSSSAEQSTIMKPTDEEIQQQRTPQGRDVGEAAEDAGDGQAAETLLRVASMALCLAAMAVMVKNSQAAGDFGSISYSDLAAFKFVNLDFSLELPSHAVCLSKCQSDVLRWKNRYLVYANGACAAYSLLSAFYVAIPRPTTLFRSWTLFLLDQLLAYITLAAGTVSTEILYLAYNGNENVTWSQSCGIFNTFCRRATTSVGITFGSVVGYVLLSLISSYRLFSGYEAPIPCLSSKSQEIAAFPS